MKGLFLQSQEATILPAPDPVSFVLVLRLLPPVSPGRTLTAGIAANLRRIGFVDSETMDS